MEVLALSERIAALDELPEDSPEVERLVEDYVRYAKASSLPQAAAAWPRLDRRADGECVLRDHDGKYVSSAAALLRVVPGATGDPAERRC